jgi:nucleoside-diphosphate-sugar epimerase
MNIILTGATGMVGEGVLLECLENPAVTKVLVVGRKPPNLPQAWGPSERVHPGGLKCLQFSTADLLSFQFYG